MLSKKLSYEFCVLTSKWKPLLNIIASCHVIRSFVKRDLTTVFSEHVSSFKLLKQKALFESRNLLKMASFLNVKNQGRRNETRKKAALRCCCSQEKEAHFPKKRVPKQSKISLALAKVVF